MSIQLSDLIIELQGKAPARNDVPTPAQYEKAIKDAVADFSRRCSRQKFGVLEVVSGTASYDLPADFRRMIKLDSLANPDGIMITGAGIIPLPIGFCEQYSYVNGQITIFPTPTYNLARNYRYAAGWALTEGDDDYSDASYDDMTDEEAAIVMLKAQADCLGLQNNAQSGGVLRYSIGDESYDKSSAVQAIASRVETLERQYLAAVDTYNGKLMVQA